MNDDKTNPTKATASAAATNAAAASGADRGRSAGADCAPTWKRQRTACSAVRRNWKTTASGLRGKSTNIAATPNLPLMHDLLPVLDNIERAIAAADKTHDVAVLLEGMKLVARQFEEIFQRHHCQRIGALHLPFDPHLHHAISQQPSDEFPPNTVVIVAQPGFQLYDRVVRPSQVIVSRVPDDATPS